MASGRTVSKFSASPRMEEYCRYLDYFTTIDISHTAPWQQRHRFDSTIRLVCKDDDRQAGPMRARRDFKPITIILTSLRQEQGRQHSFIPKNERVRQRPCDEALRPELEWQSQNWKTCWSQPSSSSSSSQQWWQREHQDSQRREHQDAQWREHQDTQWQDHQDTQCARVGNNTKRVNVRCAQWMMRAVFTISDLPQRRLCIT